ncbi:PTS sugar transporter subunit IIA [bacterium]|nr:PTS sugar transporter subunit IIA [bacterium]
MKRIAEILDASRIRDIKASTKDEAIVELCGMLRNAPEVTNLDKFITAIKYREAIMSTGIGMGIAIPHSKTSALQDFVAAVGRSKQGIDFDALDGLPVHIIILVGSSDSQAEEFLKVLAEIGAFFSNPDNKDRFLSARTRKKMFDVIAGEEA